MRRPAARSRQSVAPPPAKPRRGRPPKKIEPAKAESAEVAVSVDREQRKMVDEYGELDRRMQLLNPDVVRYDALKRAIKSWFDRVPADADAIVEGEVYRLHLSARERERRVRSMRALVDVIGLDKFLEMASVPIGALEDLLGKTRAAALVTEARTGSRRIKAVPKRPAGEK
jgi:hypothetical protein